MKKNLIGLTILAAGGAAALVAASIPGATLPSVPDTVPGIVHEAEAFGTADAAAEKGLRDVVRRCMQEQGFDYTPPDSGMVLDLHARIGAPRLDVATARAYGYAPAAAVATEPEPDSALGQLFADPAFATALHGADGGTAVNVGGLSTQLGGCTGEAVNLIYGSGEDYVRATVWANNAVTAATGEAMYDAGFAEADAAWQSCMSGTPYSFEHPGQAVDAGKQLGGHEEIQLAVTDAVCREETDFHGRLNDVLDRHLTTRMQELAPQIEQVRTIRQAAAERAAAL